MYVSSGNLKSLAIRIIQKCWMEIFKSNEFLMLLKTMPSNPKKKMQRPSEAA